MKEAPYFVFILITMLSCQNRPSPWNGHVLIQPREHLTVEELLEGKKQPFIDMSFFSKPNWAKEAKESFSGTIIIEETELNYPKEKEHYDGENFLPKLQFDFISHNGDLIPLVIERISTKLLNNGFWDIMLGTGRIWHEEEDGEWNRGSFPINLNDRWIGTVRNCVASFVYKSDSISNLCLQCSQETADIDDKGITNINGILPASFETRQFADSIQIIERHQLYESRRLSIRPLSDIDMKNEVADNFEKTKATIAPTSMGAVLLDGNLYLHPPKTRHGT